MDFKEIIDTMIKYAANSYSLELMHETYGTVRGLAMAGAIDPQYYVDISGRICKEYLNNAEWSNACHRRYE